MAQIQKEIDVKIRVIFPRLTKGISDADKGRIEAKTLFKYEPQSPVPFAAEKKPESAPVSEVSTSELRERLLTDLEKISKDFGDLADKAGKRLASISFRYDASSVNNEKYATAEEGLFGIASGEITHEKYRKIQEYSKKIDEEIRRRLIENGGSLDHVA